MRTLLPFTLLLLAADIPNGSTTKWKLLGAKGDLYSRSSTNDYALPTSGDGQCLITDSTTTTGLKWGSCSGSAGYTSVLDEGGALTARATLNFIGSAVTCVDNASRTECTITASGAPTTVGYWTAAADATLSAEKDMSALATGLVVNTAGVPSTKGSNSCTNQFPRSDNASGTWTCASITDNDVPNSITIDTATALAVNPTACGANLFVTDTAANGTLTCTQPDFSNLSGTATDAQIPNTITIDTATALAVNPVACGANLFVTDTAANGTLTCTQPAFSNLSGTATDAQIPDNITVSFATAAGEAGNADQFLDDPNDCLPNQFSNGIDIFGNMICAAVATTQLSGTVAMAQLGTTNIAGNGTTFLRGDGVWAQYPTPTLKTVLAAKSNLLLPPCNPVRRFNCRSVKGFGQ